MAISIRAYYSAPISEFLQADQEQILGELAQNHHFALEITQRNSWVAQIKNLQLQLIEFGRGQVFFEFSIPRMGKRADVVLLIDDVVFILEYKVGAQFHDKHAIDQAMDYALDLKHFHEGSHERHIMPIVISTNARHQMQSFEWCEDKLSTPLGCNGSDLQEILHNVLLSVKTSDPAWPAGPQLAYGFSESKQLGYVTESWASSGYKPTPTIIEAAQALYQGHNVDEISRSDAGAINLSLTSHDISEIIEYSKKNHRKSICFVTGVPGAGKTLAGLNISTRTLDQATDEHAVFLSGNGPLVIVLREALARDEVARAKASGKTVTKKDAARKVSAFIQNIHHFRDDGLKSNDAPNEHVVIFDEAQRAWNHSHAEKFMMQKRGASHFDWSEPEFLIGLMDRRRDWSVIVCLIGGGQEINSGEAGLTEWFNAIRDRFSHWDIYHSDQLADKTYGWGEDLKTKLTSLNAVEKSSLHLAVSIRSFRAEKLSAFVGAMIDGNHVIAAQIHRDLDKYPLAITRDIDKARTWLRTHARGSERFGLVAASGAMRLKPEGIHIKGKIDPTSWFLNGKEDVRSSYYLEDVATEFDIQGLELDWVGMCWDANFRMKDGYWRHYSFKGTKWQNVNDELRKIYLANAYRVLLTRARQGMIIFIPTGCDADPTRPTEFYDGTYEFLKNCGIASIDR